MSRYGRMRASFDSDAASLTISPPLSPPRQGHAVYFVQSPSRDSIQDGDSLSQSFSRATPRESPLASPVHPHHSKHCKQASMESLPFGAHTLKPGSRRVLPHQPSYVGGPNSKKPGYRPWAAPGTIPEGEEGIEGEKKKGLSRICLIWIAIFFTVVMFFAGAFLFWLVTMPKAPHITVQVCVDHNFASTFSFSTISILLFGVSFFSFSVISEALNLNSSLKISPLAFADFWMWHFFHQDATSFVAVYLLDFVEFFRSNAVVFMWTWWA